jgi:hypothetical protein
MDQGGLMLTMLQIFTLAEEPHFFLAYFWPPQPMQLQYSFSSFS